MTIPAGLVAGLSAEKMRAATGTMHASLVELVGAGDELWIGPLPQLVDALVTVARVDLCLARLVEGHADAMRIFQQAGMQPVDGVYGVWASRSVGTGVKATRVGRSWRLCGEVRFASGVDLIDRALVPVWLDADHHVLLDIPLSAVDSDPDSWKSSGMDASRSFTVRLANVTLDARQIGERDFYLSRPGFVVGGLCVAAVWVGGARQLTDIVSTSLQPFAPTAHQQRRLGLVEQAAWTAQSLLDHTLALLDQTPTALDHTLVGRGSSEPQIADQIARTRTAVVTACDQILQQVPNIVGPAGLSRNPRLARTLADLSVYIRQHHLDVELTRTGERAIGAHELLGE